MLLLASCADRSIEKSLGFFAKPAALCTVLCIPTAASVEDGDKKWLHDEVNAMTRHFFKMDVFDIAGKAEDDVRRAIENYDVVYVTGGNTFYLLEQMRTCNFEITIRQFLLRGGVYIGSSAGSIVACPDIAYVGSMDDPAKAPGLSDTRGLHLLDQYPVVHTDHPLFRKAAHDALSEMTKKKLPAIALNDDQAILVDGTSITII